MSLDISLLLRIILYGRKDLKESDNQSIVNFYDSRSKRSNLKIFF